MSNQQIKTVPVAVLGVGAVMPDARDCQAFWQNIRSGRNSIREVPPERWSVEDHYDPDPKAPDKSYCKIGAFVSDFEFDPLKYRIPPRVAASMDEVQKWAVDAAHQALTHAGYADKDFDRQRTAVVIGNAMAGEMQYITNLRVYFPRYARALAASNDFRKLPEPVQRTIMEQFHQEMVKGLPPITEDSMPGELSNVIAGRVANVFGLRGPNYTADAACASSLAALESALGGLAEHRYDMVLTGGVDSSMAPHSFVKFCKIGALSADGSFPFDRRANGFVMGEGCGILLLKRLEDAERDGDRILAVIRGIGSSSDGRGKGITAPNAEGQRLAVERAYRDAGISPAEVSMLEAHGTATMAGDRVEGNVVSEFFSGAGARPRSIAMGSIKSQIGHLKSAAGAAALIKTVLSIHEGVIPASLNFETPNPEIPFADSPAFVPTELMPWKSNGRQRVAGVSSFGFGGTNFHAVLSEYRPAERPRVFVDGGGGKESDRPARHLLALGAGTPAELQARLQEAAAGDGSGEDLRAPAQMLQAPERLVIEWGDAEQRAQRIKRAQAALSADDVQRWKALANQGVFRGRGRRGKVAFLFPGQGSQYLGMLSELRRLEPLVAETFREADAIMTPILGRSISDFVDSPETPENVEALRDTNVCQPAMLAADIALLRLFEQYGLRPDMVAGHSMGEYAALVAAGMLDFASAMRAVSSRAREMSGVQVDDPGKMAAVLAPRDKIQPIIDAVEGVVPANLNSYRQTVIAGATAPMNRALELLKENGLRAVELQVSHAFHSYIVAPATQPLRRMLDTYDFQPPRIPLYANVDARPYSADPGDRAANLDRLAQQIASPVRWIETIENMYADGARVFVEVGAKRVLANLTADIIDDPQVVSVASNNPKLGDWPSFTLALGALAAAGHPDPQQESRQEAVEARGAATVAASRPAESGPEPGHESEVANMSEPPVVISGAGLGLPGSEREVFAEDNVERILAGEVLIDAVPDEQRRRLAGQRIVRLVKDAPGGPVFEVIDQPDRVSRLLGRKGRFDLSREFGLDEKLVASYDVTTRLAIAAGLLALRDAGIPLVMKHKPTTTGGRLPLGYRLPDSMADETGIVFASAFPGYEQLVQEMERRQADELLAAQIAELERIVEQVGPLHTVTRRLEELRKLRGEPFGLDRKFIFRALSFGHAQFAELVGARGPNLQVNAACSSTTLALCLAADWIRLGRCRRVLVVGADDITNPTLAPWLVGGLLATGAVTNADKLEEAALPFDRRRNGMIPGMGAVGLVVEREDCCRERGMNGIVRLLGSVLGNSAYHGSRLDTEHIAELMDQLVEQVERRHGLDRRQLAGQTVFVSHETYTPARGGSAAAEVKALRRTFGEQAEQVVVANTKGYTGHPMGVGIEDAVAVKMLEHQVVPPIPNYREPDPELGTLNLSRGGRHPVRYALRLAAGFGSQVTMTLTEKVADGERIVDRARYQAWLAEISGRPDAQLEVVDKTLRIHDEAAARLEQHRHQAQETSDARTPASRQPQQTASTETAEPTTVKPEAVAAPAAAAPVETETPAEAEANTEPVAEAPAAPLGAVSREEIQEKILAIVAEKTGYPPEMLELDLDLEADLGIDTVKQAEMFSEVRAAFGIPKQDDLKLSDYPTLGHIIEFAASKLGEASGVPAETAAEATEAVAVPAATAPVETKTPAEAEANTEPVAEAPAAPLGAVSREEIQEKILAIVAEKTGYPPEMLELDLDLEADLGIDTVKQAEMFSEVRAAFGIPKQDDLKLSDYPTLGHIIEFAASKLGEASGVPAEAAAEATGAVAAPAAAAPVETETPAETETNTEPVAEAPAAPLGAVSREEIQERILAIVAEKTGYPPEMLELDLDLEADLGIDTVKQAEMFSEVRAAFGIPKQDDLKLSDYPTLGHIIEFAASKLGEASGVPPETAAEATENAAAPAAATPVETETPAETGTKITTEPEPTTEAAAAPLAAVSREEIQEKILAIVAEKTGYPPEMLELDLDLEADLGIDTVKQAEMFSEVRAAFGIPKQDDLKLSDYPTLGHIIEFAASKLGEASGAASGGVSDVAAAAAEDDRQDAGLVVEPLSSVAAESEQVRYLAPVLVGRPRARECLPTGVDLGGRTIVVGPDGAISRRLCELLRARGGDPVLVEDGGSIDQVAARVEELARQTRPQGLWLLSSLGEPVNPDSADEGAWQRTTELRAKLPFRVAKAMDGLLPEHGFFIAAVRVGGQLGMRPGGRVVDPAAGATCGLVKSLAKEWTGKLCKVVDFPDGADAGYIAETLLEEAERDPGVVEVTRLGIRRWGVGLAELAPLAAAEAQAGRGALDRADPVVLVTGGAGDITGRIAHDLASHLGGTYYLADLMPEPAADDPEVKLLGEDRQALQRAIFERLKAGGGKVTPVMVERELGLVERRAAALATLRRLRECGARASMLRLDITDTAAVQRAVKDIVSRHGRLDYVLHAAGLERSQSLGRKRPETFDLVFDVKVQGLHALLQATREVDLRGLMLFGSVAGRFGNAGQTDYAAANDLFSKCASYLRAARPGLQTLVLAYSGWDGAGMATRGSIPKQLAAAGINLIPLAEGAASVRRAFASGIAGEVVVARSLGVLHQGLREAGVDLALLEQRLQRDPERYPLLGKPLDWTLLDGLRLEVEFDPRREKFLDDHRIDGVAVLPGVMAVETFAEAALLMRPDLEVVAIEDLHFEAPFKFYRDEPRRALVRMVPSFDEQGRIIVATMETERELHGGQLQRTRHYRARIRLDGEQPQLHKRLDAQPRADIGREDIYKLYFHGPSFQVLEGAALDGGELYGWMKPGTEQPQMARRGRPSSGPMYTELAFQAAGLLEARNHQRLGLPAGVQRLVIHRHGREGGNGNRVAARVLPLGENGSTSYRVAVLDDQGRMLVELEGYRTSRLPGELPADVQRALGGQEEK